MFKIRFWWVLFRAYFSRKVTVRSAVNFWVTPFDCDINLHCNNASFLKYMDLGRWDLLIKMGLFRKMIESKLQPVVTRIEIDYKKVLPPFSRFKLESEYGPIYEKRFTIKQKFIWRNAVVAEALVWAALVENGRSVDTDRLLLVLPEELRSLKVQSEKS